jgi:hypothetical protein
MDYIDTKSKGFYGTLYLTGYDDRDKPQYLSEDYWNPLEDDEQALQVLETAIKHNTSINITILPRFATPYSFENVKFNYRIKIYQNGIPEYSADGLTSNLRDIICYNLVAYLDAKKEYIESGHK